jgi:RNA polymerase sigma factor (sigma-70 family)
MNEDRFDLEQERGFVMRLKRRNPPDTEAWHHLLVHYGPYLRRCIRFTLTKFNLPLDRADDIEQATWITAYTRVNEFDPIRKNSLRRWLDGIQQNHIRNLSRERNPLSIDEEPEDSDANFAEYLADARTPNPEQEFISDETRREILSALDLALQELPARDREIVMRRLLRKESIEHLAQDYHLKPQTVYQIMSNTKKKLRNYLLAPDLFFRVQTGTGKESQTWQK